jgi:transketolase
MSVIYTGEKDNKLFNQQIPSTMNKLMEEDEKVVWLDSDLSGCSGVRGKLKDSSRFINVGIAEANMIGIAAGMSSNGLKPYCHSFGPFASRRCFDQVFLSSGYANNPITVIGTDPGITATFNGGTHMPFEDTALYRLIPNSIVCDCSDISMLNAFLTQAKDIPGVKYIRTPRKEAIKIYSNDHEFKIGHGNVVREGQDCVIIASGIMVEKALNAAKHLQEYDIECAVIDPYTIKPLDKDLIVKYAKKCKRILVAENHNKIGGLCSAVQDAICGMELKYSYVAVEDEFGEVGPLDYLEERFKLTHKHIIEKVKNLM